MYLIFLQLTNSKYNKQKVVNKKIRELVLSLEIALRKYVDQKKTLQEL